MERLILGAWSEKAELEGFTVSGTSRYSPDHTVEHIGSVVGADSKVNFRFRSTWRIEGNTLITEVLESDQPEMVAVGYVERDTILSMSEAQWTYRDSDGMEFTVVRFQQ